MKFCRLVCGLAAVNFSVSAVIPDSDTSANADHVALHPRPESEVLERSAATWEDLVKRKGGGSSGGRGGSNSGGTSGGSSGSSSPSGSGRGSPSSNAGGLTTTGSGVRPSYGGGAFYGGGAQQPYRSGLSSPSGIAPFVIAGAGLATIGFVGAAYAHGAYVYPYTNRYYYHNATTNQNETKPVSCVCERYEVCGCDDNGNQTYFNSVIGDGSYENLNKSLVTVAENETTHEPTIYIRGTLANGTTAPGGTDDPNAAGANWQALARAAGWWPLATTALAIVCLS
ncbi:hypothetical protein GGS23DRAFT_463961 [Durotheca rogersii]|uniref:uncharacterized protein n=1 Tax=Durotheca rogersii TaxID=419775 RepID=UPI002220D9EF|nr:uncharacterized protein GGS23DRAFT_463961 [Durotheca rogersii]KAI5864799.1 hypothetical protein GGS23DRAFT_463961 [Durotheca rogersii]